MRKQDRLAALDDARIADLTHRVEDLTVDLEHERSRAAARSSIDELSNALVGELDPDRIVDEAQRAIGAAIGRTCVILRDTALRGDAATAEPLARSVTLDAAGEQVGRVCIGGRDLSPSENEMLDEMAAHVGRALGAALAVAGRSQVFHTLERSLLPDALLPLPGLQLASRYLPATGAHDVGGDFYDAVRRDDRMTLIVGDVQGKGVEAATLTSLARHTLRAGALSGRSPGALLAHLNTALLYGQAEQLHAGHDPVLRFVTAAVASIEPSADGFTAHVARAGQPPPVVVRSAGTFEHLEPRGVLLGVCQDPVYAEETVDLRVGDTLILYTDGVIEQRADGRAFSEQHLGMLVRNRRSIVDAEATAQLIEDTVHLVSPEDVRDDVAILVACVVPTSAAE